MTFPTYHETTTSTETSFVSTHNATLPATKTVDDIWILAAALTGSGGTITGPTDWDEIAAIDLNSNQKFRAYILRSDGTETGTADITSGSNNRSAMAIRRYSGVYTGTLADAWDVSADNNGGGTAPDPLEATAGWGAADNVAVAIASHHGGNDQFDGHPSGYGNTGDVENGFDAGIASADLQTTSSTENPGTFSLAAFENWAAITVFLRPEADAGGLWLPRRNMSRPMQAIVTM